MNFTQSPPLLTRAALPHLPQGVGKPEFDITKLRSGIVHLGCGAFHRAHQAAITQEAIDVAGEDGLSWGIESVCMSNAELYETLRKQDNLYSLLLKEPRHINAEVIGTLTKVLHAPTDPVGIPERIAAENIKIVTMTVTAGGYSFNPQTLRLDETNEQIIADLNDRAHPASTIGIIAKSCELIYQNGHRPPVFLSCDNLTHNGETVKQTLVDYISLYNDTLATWVNNFVQFPCTVVDRIAQPETEDDVLTAQQLLGYTDLAAVPTEPIWDWSIEEFDGPRPAWEEVGVRFVQHIDAYERGKLRILNGTHMLLAYLGALLGFTTIDQAANHKTLGLLAKQFMLTEQGATLELPPSNLKRTCDKVMRRFANGSVVQEIERVGRNGSEKMIPRITDAMRENIAHDRRTPAAILTIAAWIYSFVLTDQGKHLLNIPEPLDDELVELARSCHGDPDKLTEKFLERKDIFGDMTDPKIHREISSALHDLSTLELDEVIRQRLLPEFGG